MSNEQIQEIKQLAVIEFIEKFKVDVSLLKKKEKTICPCCSQEVGSREEKLYIGHLLLLQRWFNLYKSTGRLYHHYRDVCKYVSENYNVNTTDYTNLEDFKLIAKKPKNKKEGNSNGFWTITQRGVAFLQGKYKIPKVLLKINKKSVLEISDEQIGVHDINQYFQYDQIFDKTLIEKKKKKAKKLLEKV